MGLEKRKAHSEFVSTRNKFDKSLSQKERAYKCKPEHMYIIEQNRI